MGLTADEAHARRAGDPRPAPPRLRRVAVDARALHDSGIGRYLRELLAEWAIAPSSGALTLLGDPGQLGEFLRAHPASQAGARPLAVVPHRGGPYSPAAQWSWARTAGAVARQADVVFFPHWDAPLVRFPARSVVTVHDLTPFRVPEGFGVGRRVLGAAVLRHVVARATRVVCVSQAAAAEVRAAFPASAGRVRVIPNGVSRRFAGPAPLIAPPCDGPYLLWVGNLKPHKNLAAALDVLARLRSAGWQGLRLVVVGREFAGGDLRLLSRAPGLSGAVLVLGEVDDARLHALYAGCAALIFPSRAEGFGLPVVEAMLAGAPVVASAVPAVAEVVGDAAPVFAPDDAGGMAAYAAALLSDPGRRAKAVARGRARAAAFSWAEAARATAEVIAEAADVGTVALAGRDGRDH